LNRRTCAATDASQCQSLPAFVRKQSRRVNNQGGIMKRIFYTILAILVLLIGIAFAILNRQSVELNYYFGLKWSGPLSMALLAAFAFGVVAGYIASLRTVVRMQRQLVQARKEIRQIEQEVINLRALPIKDVI
jgi:putative membrane protein